MQRITRSKYVCYRWKTTYVRVCYRHILFIYVIGFFFFNLDLFIFSIYLTWLIWRKKIKSATASYLHLKKILSNFFLRSTYIQIM